MALFQKDKKTTVSNLSKEQMDDIFNKPIVKKKADDSELEASDNTKGPRGINSRTLEKSMEKLGDVIKEREQRPPLKDSIDGISENNMTRAEVEFENTVVQIKEKQSKISYGKIQEASVDNIDEKVTELNEKYDYLVHKKEKVDYGFNTITNEEFDSVVSNYDIEKASKKRPVVSEIPELTEEQKAKIQEFFEKNVRAKPMDFVNSIPELEKRDLERIKKYLEELNATVSV